MDDLGIAGGVFHSGVGEIVHDAYADPRFHRDVDQQTGYTTKSLICAPIRNAIIGDDVNLASRLESACKHCRARILSELTVASLKGVYRLREIDRVIVKGRTKPVAVFECLDYHNAESFPNLMEAVGAFNEGLALYRQASFDRAREWFDKALVFNPGDRVATLYRGQCGHGVSAPARRRPRGHRRGS